MKKKDIKKTIRDTSNTKLRLRLSKYNVIIKESIDEIISIIKTKICFINLGVRRIKDLIFIKY